MTVGRWVPFHFRRPRAEADFYHYSFDESMGESKQVGLPFCSARISAPASWRLSPAVLTRCVLLTAFEEGKVKWWRSVSAQLAGLFYS